MKQPIGNLPALIKSFWRDESGIILPYVTIMMVAIVGLASLALDGSRFYSLQTQMQSAADALALAGARELDQKSGARARATNAINNLVSNGLKGMGISPTLTTATPVYYSALQAADLGPGGTAATNDVDAKYVQVVVNPVTANTIMPVAVMSNQFSAGAQAIAGFTSVSYCDIPPVFICNPYETAGMTDSAATQALNTNIVLPATQQQQVRLDPTKSGPGQFGYLVPPDNCNGASCLENWIALAKPKTCFQKATVDLNTGFKSSVTDGFNVRFDIWNGNLKKDQGDPAYAPALNVRKGFALNKPAQTCSGAPPGVNTLVYPNLDDATVGKGVYPNATTATTSATFSKAGNANCKQAQNPCALTVSDTSLVTQVGKWIADGLQVSLISTSNVAAQTTVTSASGTTLIMSNPALTNATASFTVGIQVAGFPQDTSLVGNTNTFGNGQWDCDSYWKINHPNSPKPADIATGCLSAAATQVSRYQVYISENNNNLFNDYSLPGSSANGGENGAPICNGSGVGPSTTQTDRRLIFAAVINCLAQSGLITPGSTANNIPVAGFAKAFMTQPVTADGFIYVEMSGLVGLNDNVKILNQVQLYR